MYYGHYDDNGNYIGFYTPEIHCKRKPVYNIEMVETKQDNGKISIAEPGTLQVGEEWDLSTIPTPNIELLEAEWREALTGEYKVINSKHTYTPPPEPTAEEIAESQLAALDAEYQPQFQEIQLAWAAASMDGNTDLAAGIQQDYLALKSEYQTKKEAIINGNS